MSSQPAFRVERLSERHDQLAFVSGVEALDRYLHILANQDARRKVAAPFVLIAPDGAVAGYYTLSAFSVLLAEIPADLPRKFPIPACAGYAPRPPGREPAISGTEARAVFADGCSL